MSSLRIEIWSPPGIATFERRIAGIQGVSNLSGTIYRRQLGQGQFTLPADYSRLGEIVDVDPANHANDVASLARVYRGTSLIQEFLVDGTPNVISETPTQIAGPTVEAVMDWAIVEAWDWDGSDDFTSRFPDWIYGGRNVLVDPTFSDPQCSPRISEFWTNATSGSWTATVDGQTTAGIAFNATATQVEVAYEALSTVTDVLVEGDGSAETPWRVTFVTPCFPTTYSVSSGTLNGNGIVATLIEQGSQQPAGWTESRTVGFGVPIIFGNYTNFEVDTALGTHPCGGTNALHIQASTPVGFSYPGAQTTPRVEPGGLYQAGVWVYSQGTADEVRLVIRPVTEEPLIDSSAWPSTTLVANTWTFLSIPDVMIPEGIDRVIFRVASVQNSHAVNLWVTCATLTEGLAATTVGEIMGDLLDDAQTDHSPTRTTIDFINPSFTDALDSAGAAWDNDEVSISIPRGMTYRKVLESMFGPLGYEWNLTPTSGTPGEWDLNVWNPDGRVTDVTSLDTPSLLVGQGTLNGYATKRVPRANIVTAEGQGGYSSRARNSASFPVIGRREGYAYDSGYIGSLVEGWADTLLAKFLTEGLAPRFDIADPNTDERPIPIVDYGLAYRLNVDLADGDGKVSRDIEAVSWRDSDEGLVWTIHTGQAQFDQPLLGGGSFGSPGLLRGGGGVSLGVLGPTVEGTRWLLDNFRRQQAIPVATALTPSGGGGAPSITIAASDSSPLSKSKADFICSGTNDDIIFQQAADTLFDDTPFIGGRILLTEGNFHLGSTVSASSIAWEGMGKEATVVWVDFDGSGYDVGQTSEFRHMGIWNTTGSSPTAWAIDSANQLIIDNCHIAALTSGIRVSAGTEGVRIVNSVIAGDGGYAIQTESGFTSSHVVIANNLLSGNTGGIFINGALIDGHIANNYFDVVGDGIVAAGACRNTIISGCNFAVLATGIATSGTGQFIGSRITDCEFDGNGVSAIDVASDGILIDNCHIFGAFSATGVHVVGSNNPDTQIAIRGITVSACEGFGIHIEDKTAGGAVIADCYVEDITQHGIVIDNCNRVQLHDCLTRGTGTSPANTFDAINVTGDENMIHHNTLIKDNATRFGLNFVSGSCNIGVGNNLGDGWGVDALNDSATDTRLKYPDDPVYGDNWTVCEPLPS